MVDAKLISQAQATRLWTISRLELKLQDCELRVVLAEFEFTSPKLIPTVDYEKVMQRLAQFASTEF
ncbi:hypothetical protein COO91_08240 [Nostoc flagelliforme CCNUN1]|uniref:Uncharacterized protein n=1 Tax=Nostoc flagelliforme CCNUN1 TaxID=2038116 RepID=A0A2K8T3G8_9NOSO|nr:hypothetical protein [Nostoc flagelliforme]AUB42133.1 hypothetical protein COO91_08240 [Nostoc flagelliforme CCNUN1]